MNPYTDYMIAENIRVRKFDEHVSPSELVWHQDEHPRAITVVTSNNWQLQLDNQLPEVLEEGETYRIDNTVYHRLVRGFGPLVIIIKEEGNSYGI